MNYKAPIRNDKLLEEAFEAGRESVLNVHRETITEATWHPDGKGGGRWGYGAHGHKKKPGDAGYIPPHLRPRTDPAPWSAPGWATPKNPPGRPQPRWTPDGGWQSPHIVK